MHFGITVASDCSLCDPPQLWPNLKELNLGESVKTRHSDLKDLPTRIATEMKKLEKIESKVARTLSLPSAQENQVADELTTKFGLLLQSKVINLKFCAFHEIYDLSLCLKYSKSVITLPPIS